MAPKTASPMTLGMSQVISGKATAPAIIMTTASLWSILTPTRIGRP